MVGSFRDRLGTIPVNELMELVHKGSPKKEFFGKSMRLDSVNLIGFKQSGVRCEHCTIKGEYFALESDVITGPNLYVFNLYAVKDGKERMLLRVRKDPHGCMCAHNMEVICLDCWKVKKQHDQEELEAHNAK